MTPEQAIEIINYYLRIQKVKERVTLTMDLQTAVPLCATAEHYDSVLLHSSKFDEGRELIEACRTLDKYFYDKDRLEKARLQAVDQAASSSAPKECAMTTESAIEIINQHLAKIAVKDSYGRAAKISIHDEDLQNTISLINLADGYNEQLCSACHIASEYFFAMEESQAAPAATSSAPAHIMKTEQAIEILNGCLRLLKSNEKITLDLESLEGMKLSDQAIEYGKILMQRGFYTQASKIHEAGTEMYRYYGEKKVVEIEAKEKARLAAAPAAPYSAPAHVVSSIPVPIVNDLKIINSYLKAQKIKHVVSTTMDPQIALELCGKIAESHNKLLKAKKLDKARELSDAHARVVSYFSEKLAKLRGTVVAAAAAAPSASAPLLYMTKIPEQVSPSAPSFAASKYEAGVACFNRSKFREAIEHYLIISQEASNPYYLAACVKLWYIYKVGFGVSVDISKVESYGRILAKNISWFITQAKSGGQDAQFNLGVLYQLGNESIPQNLKLALKWYNKAAAQGHLFAQNNIGWMFEYGLGVHQNYEEARKCYTKGAEQGFAVSIKNLGWLFHDGKGVPKDFRRAMELYLQAAAQGYSFAQNNIGWMYQNGHGVTQDFAIAMEWYDKAAAQGNALAQANIAYLQKIKGVFRPRV